jgi:Trk K+ transport system NAD-binding subunit
MPLGMITGSDVVAFIATDSHDKEWRVPRKLFKATVKSTKEEEQLESGQVTEQLRPSRSTRTRFVPGANKKGTWQIALSA